MVFKFNYYVFCRQRKYDFWIQKAGLHRKWSPTRYHLYTISSNTISSARLRMLFIALTHAIWSLAFSSSVTPSAAFICSTIRDNSHQKWYFLQNSGTKDWHWDRLLVFRLQKSGEPSYKKTSRLTKTSKAAPQHICQEPLFKYDITVIIDVEPQSFKFPDISSISFIFQAIKSCLFQNEPYCPWSFVINSWRSGSAREFFLRG